MSTSAWWSRRCNCCIANWDWSTSASTPCWTLWPSRSNQAVMHQPPKRASIATSRSSSPCQGWAGSPSPRCSHRPIGPSMTETTTPCAPSQVSPPSPKPAASRAASRCGAHATAACATPATPSAPWPIGCFESSSPCSEPALSTIRPASFVPPLHLLPRLDYGWGVPPHGLSSVFAQVASTADHQPATFVVDPPRSDGRHGRPRSR